MNDKPRLLDLYAITAPGLEHVCHGELADIGIDGSVEDAGVAWRGDLASLYRANLHSRTATRILARLGTFRARTFAELERHAARVPWSDFVPPGAELSLRVTTRKSRLYHTGAIAQRLTGVLGDVAGARVAGVTREEDDDAHDAHDANDALLIVVRFIRDACTLSIDSSGTLLHQRGYRQALARAPLRETIAAALLRAAGWSGDTQLLDPMCGSGTIPIEAALLARRIPPGLANPDREPRPFAFQRWVHHDAGTWRAVVDAARAGIAPAASCTIIAADAHGGAIAATRANAERAGVETDIEPVRRGLAEWTGGAAGHDTGHIVTNPPYGVRVGDRRMLASLYTELGQLARRWDGVTAFLAADAGLEAAVGLPLRQLLATRNGGIAVRFLAVEHRDDPGSAA